jgi:cytochrome c biogenesis protein CcmG/thiol:disulfide interchange protein DsbE
MQRKNQEQGFEVVGMSMDEKGWEVVKPFLAKMSMTYRVVIGDDATAEKYGRTDPKLSKTLDQLPTTFLIDREGRIASAHEGLTGKNVFEEEIKQLLAEPAPDKTAAKP